MLRPTHFHYFGFRISDLGLRISDFTSPAIPIFYLINNRKRVSYGQRITRMTTKSHTVWGMLCSSVFFTRTCHGALALLLITPICTNKIYAAEMATLLPAAISDAASLGEALDCTNLVWTSGGLGRWRLQTGVTHDGQDAAQSGPISSGIIAGWTTLKTTVTGPASLSFWWRITGNSIFGPSAYPAAQATVKVGNVVRASASEHDFPVIGSGWLQRRLDIPAGPQEVQWSLSISGGCTTPAEGTIWLDQIVVSAPDELAITFQPQDQQVIFGRGGRLTVGATGPEPIQYQWYYGVSGDCAKPIVGATASTLNVGPSATTSYWARVSAASDSIDSRSALVTVLPELSAYLNPEGSMTLLISGKQGTLGSNVKVECSADLQTWVPIDPIDPYLSSPSQPILAMPIIPEGRRFYRVVQHQ